jgi:hypothetical protein
LVTKATAGFTTENSNHQSHGAVTTAASYHCHSHKSCWRHYNSNFAITTASTAHQQQRFLIQVLVFSQQPLLPSQQHYSRIAITTAASHHSHSLAPSQQQSPGFT